MAVENADFNPAWPEVWGASYTLPGTDLQLIIIWVRCLAAMAITLAFFAISADAVRELVILDDPLPAQRVEGVVLDPAGAPIPGRTVSDSAPGWAAVQRSTTTDSKGRFRLSRQPNKSMYYLRFDHRLFNPLALKIRLDKNAPQRGIIARPEIGG